MVTNPFIGRTRELAQLTRLVHDNRLVTVMGPPGAGKTRLVAEAMPRFAGRFDGGVFWCELAQLQAPERVEASVAAALGFVPEVQTDVGRLARERFGDSRVVLVIDNCEHLRKQAAATIATLLEATPAMHILATSRERLKVPGEAAWTLPPLRRDEAVELLVSRASSVESGFEVTADNRSAINQICERLGDLPLAVELVAPRLAMLPAGQIIEMLNDDLTLLTSEQRSVRQQSITTTMDWSAGLLAPVSRDDLWRLGVFPAAFTLDAATAVLGTSTQDVIDRLGVLRDASLLVADVSGTTARFRLLEPIRQYSLAHLVRSPLEREVRRRHTEHVWHRSEWIGDHLLGTPEQVGALTEFEELLPDIRLAVAWAVDEEPGLAVQIVANTGWAWEITGRLREGEALERRMLPLANDLGSKSRLLNRLGSLLNRRTWGHTQAGMGPAAISAARESGDKRELAYALCFARNSERPEESSAQLDEAAAIAAETGDRLILSWERFFRGILSALGGNLELARTCFEEATENASALRDIWSTSVSSANVVQVCLLLHDLHAAQINLRSTLPVLIEHPNLSYAASVVHHAAELAARTGQPVEALRLVAAHRRLSEEIGSTPHRNTDEIEQTARAQLAGRSKPDRYLAEGARLSVTEALTLALHVVEQPVPNAPQRNLKNRNQLLTRRELEVVRLVVDGLTNREIAAKLFITERSAEGHVERIRNKLDVRSRAQVAVWAAEHGLAIAGKTEAAQD
jgi:predicted ATPase/DNA-binding CsgD family transcriptional regulator